jgi:hypothetical protein
MVKKINDNYNLEKDEPLEGEEIANSDIYPVATIKITKSQFSLYELKRKYENKERQDIILNPDFQRNPVWTKKQNAELIESILMNVPLPVFYFFEKKDGKKQIVDGRQRLTAIFDYMNNKFTLGKLKILKDFSYKKFSSLAPVYQSSIEDYQILAYVIQPPTPERVKFDIFDRVNRGGTSLNNQEMRNALYQGKATDLLNKLSKEPYFLKATGQAVKPARMKDKYVILRFLGFYILFAAKDKENLDIEYKSDIDEFLAKIMEYINNSNDQKISFLTNVFIQSMHNAYNTLGSNGFRFENKISKSKRPVNMPLFELLALFFTNFSILKNLNTKKKFKEEIDKFKQEIDNPKFIKQVDSTPSVLYRFSLIEKLFKRIQNC